jgi:hypothetical protein
MPTTVQSQLTRSGRLSFKQKPTKLFEAQPPVALRLRFSGKAHFARLGCWSFFSYKTDVQWEEIEWRVDKEQRQVEVAISSHAPDSRPKWGGQRAKAEDARSRTTGELKNRERAGARVKAG